MGPYCHDPLCKSAQKCKYHKLTDLSCLYFCSLHLNNEKLIFIKIDAIFQLFTYKAQTFIFSLKMSQIISSIWLNPVLIFRFVFIWVLKLFSFQLLCNSRYVSFSEDQQVFSRNRLFLSLYCSEFKFSIHTQFSFPWVFTLLIKSTYQFFSCWIANPHWSSFSNSFLQLRSYVLILL